MIQHPIEVGCGVPYLSLRSRSFSGEARDCPSGRGTLSIAVVTTRLILLSLWSYYHGELTTSSSEKLKGEPLVKGLMMSGQKRP